MTGCGMSGFWAMCAFWFSAWRPAMPPPRPLAPPRSVAQAVAPPGVEACVGNTRFLVGAGLHDITGTAAEQGMMGYGRVDQRTAGIHTRLRSRAFVIASPCNGKRVIFVSADLGQIFQGVKQKVIARLKATYGPLYDDQNVVLSATHTHSGPGGYSHDALYNLTILGFDPQNLEVIVDGIYQSIVNAHDTLAEGAITVAEGELLGASRNRSPRAYLLNPTEDRVPYPSNVDTRMTVLKLTHVPDPRAPNPAGDHGETHRETAVGMIDWFAVHGTSMGNDNRLISGDNKGYASYLFEKRQGTDYFSSNTFVAAFANSDEGDVTPNINGGTDGGGVDAFDSTSRSGQKQYNKAVALYDAAHESLVGGVDFRHTFVKMDAVTVAASSADGVSHTTCPAAIGLSMLAGADDGPGYGHQGETCQHPDSPGSTLLCAISQTPCQAEKPIVLEMGTQTPFPWTPEVLPLQVVTLGNLAIVALPYEVTTVAGRRLRDTVEAQLRPLGVRRVILSGLANAYAGYLATREEYAAQDYEGASTHFGPWQLAATQQEVGKLARALREQLAVPQGPLPRDLSCCQLTFQPGVLYDDTPHGVRFGGVYQDAAAAYVRGQTARVVFWGGHPRNDLRTQDSFLRVQRKNADNTWTTVAYDWDWETKYRWARVACFPTFGCSHSTVEWKIPETTAPGTYRLRHDGSWKNGWDGSLTAYSGHSREFSVN